jgi:hypothetical protein
MIGSDAEELYKRTVITKVELNNAKEDARLMRTRVQL